MTAENAQERHRRIIQWDEASYWCYGLRGLESRDGCFDAGPRLRRTEDGLVVGYWGLFVVGLTVERPDGVMQLNRYQDT